MSRALVSGAVAVLALSACGGSSGSGTPAGPSPYEAGFNPTAVAAGYTRYITPEIDGIPAGSSNMYCQWLTPPSDIDQDIVDVVGQQSKFGHHAIMYATTEIEPVGTTRVCTTADMLSVAFLGGVGGEGDTGVTKDLPPNTAFRLSKGQALLANAHYLNTSMDAIDGQSVLDIKFVEPSANRQIAGYFVNNGDTFSIPPHSMTSYDVTCPIAQDMSFFLFGNHMHQNGFSVFSELLHADGTSEMIVQNTYWTLDMEYNTPWVSFPTSAMLQMHSGDKLHTHCEWTGDASMTTVFPTEMCVGSGFNMTEGPQLVCDDGQWPTP